MANSLISLDQLVNECMPSWRKPMADLTAKERAELRGKDFGLPMERKYPVQDRAHAANAKARAAQQVDAGNLSEEDEAKIDAKANKVLKGK